MKWSRLEHWEITWFAFYNARLIFHWVARNFQFTWVWKTKARDGSDDKGCGFEPRRRYTRWKQCESYTGLINTSRLVLFGCFKWFLNQLWVGKKFFIYFSVDVNWNSSLLVVSTIRGLWILNKFCNSRFFFQILQFLKGKKDEKEQNSGPSLSVAIHLILL